MQQNGALFQMMKDMYKEIQEVKHMTQQLQVNQNTGLFTKVIDVMDNMLNLISIE